VLVEDEISPGIVADIVKAYVSNNWVAVADLGGRRVKVMCYTGSCQLNDKLRQAFGIGNSDLRIVGRSGDTCRYMRHFEFPTVGY
jgi:hypothetical protein